MGNIWEYVVIFLLASVPWIEIAAAIPLGFIRGLQPVPVVVLGFFGNLVTTLAVIFLFDKTQKLWTRKKVNMKEGGKRQERARKIWNKYGLPGLALLGPILIGIHIAAFIGLTLGAAKKWTAIWMTISLVIWSVVFGVGSYYGMETIKFLIK